MVSVSLAWNLFGIWLFGEGHSFSDGIRFLAMLIATSGRSLRQRSPRIALALLAFMVIGCRKLRCFRIPRDALLFQTPETQPCLVQLQSSVPKTGEATRQAPARPFIPREKLFDHPAVYEFNGPLRSSYPPWFDPTYWNDGLSPTFRFGTVARHVLHELFVLGTMLLHPTAWLVGMFLILLAPILRKRSEALPSIGTSL